MDFITTVAAVIVGVTIAPYVVAGLVIGAAWFLEGVAWLVELYLEDFDAAGVRRKDKN